MEVDILSSLVDEAMQQRGRLCKIVPHRTSLWNSLSTQSARRQMSTARANHDIEVIAHRKRPAENMNP